MRTFEFSDAKSHKFWTIDRQGTRLTVTFGRIGSAGQTQVKEFPDEAKAEKEHAKLVAEKLGKGYREMTPTAKAPASLRESLEQALVDNPDDLASHMAYADYLTEQGDPLGEFIRVQLQLEDETRPAAQRKKLQQQEAKLIKAHGRAWLGELAPLLLDQKPEKERSYDDLRITCTFARGWLHTLKAEYYDVATTRALAKAPQVRLLHRLELRVDRYLEAGEFEPGPDIPDEAEYPHLYPLARCPYLTNVRVFQLGEMLTAIEEAEADDGAINCHTEGDGVLGVIKQMPRLEELYLLAHRVDAEQLFSLKTLDRLRVLLLYHNDSYPLPRLAKNPALSNLTHLLCHPHALDDEDAYIRLAGVRAVVRAAGLKSLTHLRLRLSDMGDKGAREIADSGVLKRLKVLDLRHGCITDVGARALAACADLKNLELLELTNNAVGEAGLAALRATGVRLVADRQWVKTGDETEYLYAGDIE